VPPNRATFFFTQHFGMGVHWYEEFFAHAGQRVAGEICEEYLSSAEALERIHDYAPDMHLICCLRNPYERAISSWRFFGRNGLGEPTLVAQAERYPAVIDGGFYATHLQTMYSLFRKEQVLTFFFEDLAADPRGVVRRLYAFIGADPEFIPGSMHKRINGNGRPRSTLLARLVHDIHALSWGTSRTASNAIGNLKRVRPLRRLVQMALYAEDRRPLRWQKLMSEFPDEVIARYEGEISGLERMLGRDLSSWRAASAARLVPSGRASGL
jgi:hypothetical protein